MRVSMFVRNGKQGQARNDGGVPKTPKDQSTGEKGRQSGVGNEGEQEMEGKEVLMFAT
jgi:hypothetical protein